MAIDLDGKTLAVGYYLHADAIATSVVELWDVATRTRLWGERLGVKDPGVSSVTFTPDGKSLVAEYVENGIRGEVRWDVVTRKRLSDERITVKRTIAGLMPQPRRQDHRDCKSRRFDAWSVDQAKRNRLTQEPLSVTGEANSVAFSPKVRRLRPDTVIAASAAAWCCGTYPRGHAWRKNRSRSRSQTVRCSA